jgi:hypothetical protein
MNEFSRRNMVKMCLATLPLSSRIAAAGSWIAGDTPKPVGESFDWSKGVISGVMNRRSDPATLGKWGYAISLYLRAIPGLSTHLR